MNIESNMFSVIIPLYNKAPYIETAIRSVAAQTCRDFELIIIDDGSTDDGFGIAEKMLGELSLSFGGWRAIRQHNSGVSAARNNGVQLAQYEYIAFLDADDWWAATYLEEMKRLIAQFPEAGIYGSSYYKVKKGRPIQANIGVHEGFQRGLINYFKVYAQTLWMPLWTGATIIKKTAFEAFKGFPSHLKLGEDFYLWSQVATKYPVAYINVPLAYYNQDVERAHRAVGPRLYEPNEHMLFVSYPSELMQNKDFEFLFQRLALYGLMPYYASKKNSKDVDRILNAINWRAHERKYFVYYNLLSPAMLRWWFAVLKLGSNVKGLLRR